MGRAHRGWYVDFDHSTRLRLGAVKRAKSPDVAVVVLARLWGVRVHVWAADETDAVLKAEDALAACPHAFDQRRLVCHECGAVAIFDEAGEISTMPCGHAAIVVFEDRRTEDAAGG